MRKVLASKFSFAFVAFGIVTAIASPASAQILASVHWGQLSASYNGQTRATAYGDFADVDHVAAVDYVHLNDPANDGNNVYAHVTFLFYARNARCGTDTLGNPLTCWYRKSTASTGEYNFHNTPVERDLSTTLDAYGTNARGSTQVCVQMGWPIPDKCSAPTLPTFGY